MPVRGSGRFRQNSRRAAEAVRWYRTAIPYAEQLYADYLAEREKEMGP